jgi:hypothetical protein
MTPEQKIVQLGHATYEAGLKFKHPGKTASLILLHAHNEADLHRKSRILELKDIDFCMFYEPDNDLGFTAICTRPIFTNKERAVFAKWNLYKHTG